MYYPPAHEVVEELKVESHQDHDHQQPCLVKLIFTDLQQLIRERFLDDQKSLSSKIRVRQALSHLLEELDQEITRDTQKILGSSEDSTLETSNPSPAKTKDSDQETATETLQLALPEPAQEDDTATQESEEFVEIENDDETGLNRLFFDPDEIYQRKIGMTYDELQKLIEDFNLA